MCCVAAKDDDEDDDEDDDRDDDKDDELRGIAYVVDIEEGMGDIDWNVETVDEPWGREEGDAANVCEFVGVFAVCVCIIEVSKVVDT